MTVTSTTLAGVNVWQFSGTVTDAEIKAAWASLIVNQRYKPGRVLYIDDTCSLLGVRGTYYVDCENLGLILHSSRNKANTVFSNWIFTQTVGLSVGARGQFVRFTNGTVISTAFNDGIDMKGGGMIYAVVGNPGGADPRFLNEMNFGSLDGTIVTSQAFAEQELQPVSYGTIWRGLNIQKCANIPIVNQGNQVVYRTNFNTEIAAANPISLYAGSNGCFVSTVMRKQGAAFSSSLANTYGTIGTKTIMILNNWQDESYFGTAKTTIAATNWSAQNRFIGGVLKKVQAQPSTLINVYDSRSTTAPAKSTFSETTADFLSGTTGTTTDAITGRATFVVVGAIATGSARTIVRYTGQKYTLQKFGYRVQVETPDLSFGDDDLSAFSPITQTLQNGLVRGLAAITAATSIESYRELLEELHALATTLVGAASYNGAYSGNLFELSGNTLTTQFASVLVDKTAAQKISYNSTTGALTIKSTTLASGTTVTQWTNTTGPISTANGAAITGVYADSNGQRVRVFGLDPEGFGVTWYLRHRIKGTSTFTNINGTGNQTLVILAAGAYDFQARAPGYDWRDADIDTSVSLSLDMALRYQVSANNTPQYTMAYDAALESIFQYDATAMKVSVTNTTAGILQPGFAELYQATQRIQHIPGLVWTWTAPVTANATSQKILIPTSNPISMYLTDASTATVKITCPIIHADTGQSADDRVRGNPSGYSIILGSPATAESAGLATQIISGLGGAGYTESEASQTALKALIDQVQTLVQQVKARTDLVPNEPAAVGSAMTLTGDYDAAKTAATQASVDALATATGTPLQASAYTAPANADIAAIKAKTDTLVNTDTSTLATAAQVTALATATGTPLQASAYTAPANADIAAIKAKTDTLPAQPATQASVDAVGSMVDAIGGVVTDLPTLPEIEASTLAKTSDLVAMPAAVTAAVWTAATRTLTETPGLTTGQAEQLRKMAQLHGVGAELVVTETTRTAGDVSQTITTTDDQTTVSAA